jgi:hypothetical protein
MKGHAEPFYFEYMAVRMKEKAEILMKGALQSWQDMTK